MPARLSPYFLLHCDDRRSKLFINITTLSNLFNNTTSGSDLEPILHATLLEVTNITSDSLVIDVSRLRANLSRAINTTSCGFGSSSRIFLPPYPGPFLISNDNQFYSSPCTSAVYITANITYNSSSLIPASDPDAYENYNYTTLESCSCHDSCQRPDGQNCKSLTLKYNSRFAFQSVDYQYLYYSDKPYCSVVHGGFSTFFHPDYTVFSKELFRLKLKWALPSNLSIHDATKNICSPNVSKITIVEGVPGYVCSCRPGYTGDGYLKGSGCKDIDECNDVTMSAPLHYCDVSRSRCHNLEGNYTCKCNGLFHVGDGRIGGSGCQFSHSLKLVFAISSAIVVFLFIIRGFVYLASWWQGRRKRKYFLENGGLQMQAYFRTRPGREMTRLFKAEELRAATNNYAEDMKIGEGGFGVVFKGRLNDGRLVAIKKAKIMGSKRDAVDSGQVFNEMAILTQINHRHIVQLLGFCLETEAPLLVYEYVSNGNLAENLEAKRGTCVMILSWEQRLKVARQIAEALAYLHGAASPPILHRDIKSSNVLLDNNLDAKVSDFGLSRLVSDGVKQVSTVVQGTIGYLDPEYFQTLQLTDKSDVYGIGVMLTELITSLKPVDSRNREPCFANLALFFIHRMEEDKLDELIDARLLISEASTGDACKLHIHSSIMAVAALARQCLALEGCMRPSMSQVVDELRHISRSLQAVANENDDEAAPLLSSSRGKALGPAGASAVLIESEYHSLHSGSVDNTVFSSILGR